MASPRSAVRSTTAGDQPARIVPRVDDPARVDGRQGTAVARTIRTDSNGNVVRATGSVAIPRPRNDYRGTTVFVNRPQTVVYYRPHQYNYYNRHYYYPYYASYYYYPRHLYPYGYGAFGLGYFYYDPYVWAPVASFYYNGYNYGYGYGNPIGELRLQVRPRDAEVYVDGYYAGEVDDFDGVFQSLRLEEGEYRIEIVAPGYDSLEFDVRIQAGRKVNYRRDLFTATAASLP